MNSLSSISTKFDVNKFSKAISFSEFEISEGLIKFNCKTYENGDLSRDDSLFFDLNLPLIVDNNRIVTALSTLCGEYYDGIYIDLEINNEMIENLKLFTKADIYVKEIDFSKIDYFDLEDKISLNFSGGFDSLAAYCILPKNTELCSVDFGDDYIRESQFFTKFNPHIVKTNFRGFGYFRHSWTFSSITTILFSGYLKNKYVVSGNVLEASYHPLLKSDSLREKIYTPPLLFLGINELKFTQGLTEIGTLMIVMYYKPYLILDSLNSLAYGGSEKFYRKQLLLVYVGKRYGLNFELEYVEPNNKINWGDNFSLDMLTLYQIKMMGIEKVSKYMENIPQEAIDLSNKLSLKFFEKYNTNFLNNIPEKFRADFLNNLSNAKIYPYNSKDWNELEEVSKFLANYHKDFRELLDNDN